MSRSGIDRATACAVDPVNSHNNHYHRSSGAGHTEPPATVGSRIQPTVRAVSPTVEAGCNRLVSEDPKPEERRRDSRPSSMTASSRRRPTRGERNVSVWATTVPRRSRATGTPGGRPLSSRTGPAGSSRPDCSHAPWIDQGSEMRRTPAVARGRIRRGQKSVERGRTTSRNVPAAARTAVSGTEAR